MYKSTAYAVLNLFFEKSYINILAEHFYIFSICQSIGSLPMETRKLFALEKGLLPKKPLLADRGLGWTDFIIKCFGLFIMLSFD